AHLSRGMALEKVGSAIDPGSLVAVETPAPDVHPGRIHCQVLGIDRFGNIQINVREGDLAAAELDQGPVVTQRTVWRGLPVPAAPGSSRGGVPRGSRPTRRSSTSSACA